MNKDTIYRQTAIDALCRRCDLVAEDDEPCTEKCNDIKILEKIPPAQPEKRTKERTETHARDCISRQAAIDTAVEAADEWDGGYSRSREEMITMKLRMLPSAQPERKRGEWIFVRGEEAGNALYECSECGKGDIHAPEVRVSYCWNCGAQMEVEA